MLRLNALHRRSKLLMVLHVLSFAELFEQHFSTQSKVSEQKNGILRQSVVSHLIPLSHN